MRLRRSTFQTVEPDDVFFDRFIRVKLNPEYEELVIDASLSNLAEATLQIGSNTLKFLKLTTQLEYE